MESNKEYDFPMKGIHRHVSEYIRSLPDLSGKVVLDIPCGDGRASYEFLKKNAEVKSFDLFPDFIVLDDAKAEYADLADPLPLAEESVDYIICQEGIEHVPNQLKVLEEFNRVLKKGGVLLITTPNYSNLRSRMANFFLESDYWKRMPPTEIDSIWFAENESSKLYFGHLFLLGVQRFKSLLTFAGFSPSLEIKTDTSNTSFLLGLLLYPLLVVVTLLSNMIYRGENGHIELSQRRDILWERVKLNLSPKTLFNKHIFWVLHKEFSRDEVVAKLKRMHRK